MATVQSIDRAFGLLEELARQPAGISDLARKVGLPTSTVARLLATLEGCHAVERNPDGTGYRIGPSIVTISRLESARSGSPASRTESSDDTDMTFIHPPRGIPTPSPAALEPR